MEKNCIIMKKKERFTEIRRWLYGILYFKGVEYYSTIFDNIKIKLTLMNHFISNSFIYKKKSIYIHSTIQKLIYIYV